MSLSLRREQIISLLKQQKKPLSASAIAERCGVSRQVIVGDIALLRASGYDILATPRGYLIEAEKDAGIERVIVCRHDNERLAKELYIVVDNGGGVVDVTVEHSVYGEISASLHIYSRYDVEEFLRRLQESPSQPLCNLTDGIHSHRIHCPDEERFKRIESELEAAGILFVK